ncbi:hypothetical protein DFAR_1110049 [Desulfarculales bacterium]
MAQALSKIDLGGVKAGTLDETVSKRYHNYVTVFIDLDRKQKPVIFVTSGKNKGCLVLYRRVWSATGYQPSWPPSAKSSPAPTSPWTGSM